MRHITNSLMNSTVAYMAAGGRGSALRTVEDEPEVQVEGDQSKGETIEHPEGEPEAESEEMDAVSDDEDKPAFAFVQYDDLPDDLPKPRAKSARINLGFKDMPLKAAVVIPKAIVDRARGAVQNAQKTKGVANGKAFVSREARDVTNKDGTKRYPQAHKGDKEFVRTA